MQNPPGGRSSRWSPRHLLRRILFPYSGADALSLKQSVRVMLAWILFFPSTMALLAAITAVLLGYSVRELVTMAALSFLAGVCIFGVLGWLIIVVNNRAARIRRAWKAQKGQQ